MLQHNGVGARAHWTHAVVVGAHALCCGLPAAAMLAAALSGATSGAALLSDSYTEFHSFLHAHEVWVIAISAVLVVTGAVLEIRERRSSRRGIPWLFVFSVLCFVLNTAIVAAHNLIGG